MKTIFNIALLSAALVCSANIYANNGNGNGNGGGNGGGGQQPPSACVNPNTNLALTSMYAVSDLDKNNLLTLAPHYGDCYGLYNDPQSAYGIFSSGDNLGRYGEGLLNGFGGYFDPLAEGLITADQLMDIDGDGSVTDPGWISLFSYNLESTSGSTLNEDDGYLFTTPPSGYFNITNTSGDTINVSEFLDFGFTCTNGNYGDCKGFNWTLITKPDIVTKAQEFLGNRSTFDMLTFVFKIGNAWAVYNLDFNKIFGAEFANGNPINDPFETAFGFQGTFAAGDFGGKGISHFGVFARDPIQTTSIPAPATIAIMGLGLLVIRLFRRR